MRKFIVSSLAVIALAAGGFAANTLLNTQIAQAQPPFQEGEEGSTTGTISTLGGCMICTNGTRAKNGSGNTCGLNC